MPENYFNIESVQPKCEIMREEAEKLGYDPQRIERNIGGHAFGEAVVAEGVDGDIEETTNHNEVAVTIAQSSEEFRVEARKALEETDVSFPQSSSSDDVFETVEGTENNVIKGITEW